MVEHNPFFLEPYTLSLIISELLADRVYCSFFTTSFIVVTKDRHNSWILSLLTDASGEVDQALAVPGWED